MPHILPNDEIAESINSLNSKEREVFNVIHTWAIIWYIMGLILNQSIYLFQEKGVQANSFGKVICNAISKTLFYLCKNPEKPRALLLGPTAISAVNIAVNSKYMEPPFILVLVLELNLEQNYLI